MLIAGVIFPDSILLAVIHSRSIPLAFVCMLFIVIPKIDV